MNIARNVAIAAVVALGVTGCSKSVEGTYHLDKTATQKVVEAKIAKMPAAQRPMAKAMAEAMLSKMDVTLTLKSGGKLVSTVSFALGKGKPARAVTKNGTWKADGDTITVDSGSRPEKCRRVHDGLQCESGVHGAPPFVFLKT